DETPAANEEEPTAQTAPAEIAGAEDEEAAGTFAGGTSAVVKFGVAGKTDDEGVSYDTLSQLLEDALERAGHPDATFALINPEYREGSIRPFKEWEVKLALPPSEAQQVLNNL